jgi:hypothetical protein
MKRKAIIISIIVISLIIVAVASWLIYNKYFKKPTDTDSDSDTDSNNTNTTPTKPTGGPTDVRAFQDWMDAYRPNWVNGKNLKQGIGYGTYGPSTQKAWAIYKNEYVQFFGSTFTPTFIKGQKVIPRFPLLIAPAYLNGTKIGDFKSALVNEQINATTMYADIMIPTGALNIPTSKRVQLQTKDWIKA